jgi:hypothetical protein
MFVIRPPSGGPLSSICSGPVCINATESSADSVRYAADGAIGFDRVGHVTCRAPVVLGDAEQVEHHFRAQSAGRQRHGGRFVFGQVLAAHRDAHDARPASTQNRMYGAGGLGGRSGVGCQILFRRRCDRRWLDGAGSLRQVNDAVLAARGTLAVGPRCCRSASVAGRDSDQAGHK